MISVGFVVALAGLACAAEFGSPFEAAPNFALNGVGLTNGFNGLVAREDQCLATEDTCGTAFCMPKGGSCCDTIKGTYCRSGFYCYPQGCCPTGKICTGGPKGGCETGKQECGSVCITGSSVCCNPKATTNNAWCDYPKTCGTDGICVSRTMTTSATSAPSSTSSSGATADATETGGSATTSGGSSAKSTGDNSDSDNNNGNNNNKDEKKTPVGAIVGGVVGGVAAIALIALGIFFLLRHKKKQKDATQGQNVQQFPPTQPPMQQYPPQASPYVSNVSPAQGMGYPPPQGSPPPQGYYNSPPPVSSYSPSLATEKVSSPTGTYSTDPRTTVPSVSPAGFGGVGATPPPPAPHAGQGYPTGGQPVVHEMSARQGDDHRGNIHELA
ncbi:syndecan domain-containing protein [Pochonia chlamydosporia 170]|uniref:Syndecan domain-containing protein n=1 Tax=Pochonia chlamydosporia 170 TaxID=1380566 RepID=A0A179G8F6_METCM|nr:syndecan domain-containing protein [Pochonia chlamydosporia 170]OAQ74085.1 syndecan domain-containing protein [Pochonia chlamydosporia 170]